MKTVGREEGLWPPSAKLENQRVTGSSISRSQSDLVTYSPYPQKCLPRTEAM